MVMIPAKEIKIVFGEEPQKLERLFLDWKLWLLIFLSVWLPDQFEIYREPLPIAGIPASLAIIRKKTVLCAVMKTNSLKELSKVFKELNGRGKSYASPYREWFVRCGEDHQLHENSKRKSS